MPLSDVSGTDAAWMPVLDDAPLARDVHCELADLVLRHCWLLDLGRASELWRLYTPDGVLEGAGLRLDGRDAIRAFGKARDETSRHSRHVCSNTVFWRGGDDVTRGRSSVTLYRTDRPLPGPASPVMVFDYVDRFEVARDGWRFARRDLVVTFEGQPS